jgi:hypothetical protein
MLVLLMIEMCLNETYSEVRIGERLSDTYPIPNDLKQRDALLPLLFSWFRICHCLGPGKPGGTEIKWDTSAADAAVLCDDVNLLGDNRYHNEDTQSLIDSSKEVCLEVNAEKTNYMLLSPECRMKS